MNITIKVLIFTTLASSALFGKTGWRDFSSARLNSTAGAGVGSILFQDSIYLNPASVAFFNKSAIGYQRFNYEQNITGSKTEGTLESLQLVDTSTDTNGVFSYNYKNFLNIKTVNYSLSLSKKISGKTATGLKVSHFKDQLNNSNTYSFTNIDFGLTHLLNNDITLGFLYKGLKRHKQSEHQLESGTQISISENLSLIADVGFNPSRTLDNSSFYRAAMQVSILDSFYFRLGQANDNSNDTTTNSWGLSWVGPKLSIDYSYQTISFKDNSQTSDIKDTTQSLGLLVRF